MKKRNKYNYAEKMHKLFEGVNENINETTIPKYNDTELLKQCIIDIRNLKKLDTEMINTISNMCNDNIIKVINTYNDVIDAFSKYIDTMK